jgi:hypothetical protein
VWHLLLPRRPPPIVIDGYVLWRPEGFEVGE